MGGKTQTGFLGRQVCDESDLSILREEAKSLLKKRLLEELEKRADYIYATQRRVNITRLSLRRLEVTDEEFATHFDKIDWSIQMRRYLLEEIAEEEGLAIVKKSGYTYVGG